MPADVPRVAEARVDGTVIFFSLVVAGLTTIIIGVFSASPGIFGAGAALDMATTRTTARLRGAGLVSAELAIGLVLSVLATLMIRSFVNLGSVDLGFEPKGVAVGRVSLPSAKYKTDAQSRQFFDALQLARRRNSRRDVGERCDDEPVRLLRAVDERRRRVARGRSPRTVAGDRRPIRGRRVLSDTTDPTPRRRRLSGQRT